MQHPAHRNNWIRGHRLDVDRIKRAEARGVGLALCDAMAAWHGGEGEGARPDLALIQAALRQKSSILNGVAASALALVLRHHESPADRLPEVFKAVPAAARATLLHEKWLEVLDRKSFVDFVRGALADRSIIVRRSAVEVVGWRRLAELASRVDELAQEETAPKVREVYAMCASLARLGYWVEKERGEDVVLWVQADAWRSALRVPRSVVQDYGLERVAESARTRGPLWPLPWEEKGAASG